MPLEVRTLFGAGVFLERCLECFDFLAKRAVEHSQNAGSVPRYSADALFGFVCERGAYILAITLVEVCSVSDALDRLVCVVHVRLRLLPIVYDASNLDTSDYFINVQISAMGLQNACCDDPYRSLWCIRYLQGLSMREPPSANQIEFDEVYVTSSEICERLDIQRSTLVLARQRGELPEPIVVNGAQIHIWKRADIDVPLEAYAVKLRARRGLPA